MALSAQSAMSCKPPRPEPENVFYRIQRGLAGYVSYLAACEMNETFSEYVLYEPILRIFTARGYSVVCESDNTGLLKAPQGEAKKMDFEVRGHELHFAVEVKWAREPNVEVDNDVLKLSSFLANGAGRRAFLCVFGVLSAIEAPHLSSGQFTEVGELVYAQFGITRYGCRIYQLAVANGPATPAPATNGAPA